MDFVSVADSFSFIPRYYTCVQHLADSSGILVRWQRPWTYLLQSGADKFHHFRLKRDWTLIVGTKKFVWLSYMNIAQCTKHNAQCTMYNYSSLCFLQQSRKRCLILNGNTSKILQTKADKHFFNERDFRASLSYFFFVVIAKSFRHLLISLASVKSHFRFLPNLTNKKN